MFRERQSLPPRLDLVMCDAAHDVVVASYVDSGRARSGKVGSGSPRSESRAPAVSRRCVRPHALVAFGEVVVVPGHLDPSSN